MNSRVAARVQLSGKHSYLATHTDGKCMSHLPGGKLDILKDFPLEISKFLHVFFYSTEPFSQNFSWIAHPPELWHQAFPYHTAVRRVPCVWAGSLYQYIIVFILYYHFVLQLTSDNQWIKKNTHR